MPLATQRRLASLEGYALSLNLNVPPPAKAQGVMDTMGSWGVAFDSWRTGRKQGRVEQRRRELDRVESQLRRLGINPQGGPPPQMGGPYGHPGPSGYPSPSGYPGPSGYGVPVPLSVGQWTMTGLSPFRLSAVSSRVVSTGLSYHLCHIYNTRNVTMVKLNVLACSFLSTTGMTRPKTPSVLPSFVCQPSFPSHIHSMVAPSC